MKHALTLLMLAATALCAQTAAFVETWSQASADKFPGWVLVHGKGECRIVATPRGQVLQATPRDLFMIRTERVHEVGDDLSLRVRLSLPSDASGSGAGFGVRNEQLGPEVGYRLLFNVSQKRLILFRLTGPSEVRIADANVVFPEGEFVAELRVVRSGRATGARLVALVNDKPLIEHEDAENVALGRRVRVMLNSRGGKSMNIGSVELGSL